MESHELMRVLTKKYGSKHIASALGRSQNLVNKWTRPQPPGTGARNPLDQAALLLECTANDDRLLNWLCAQAGGRFVRGHELPALARQGLEQFKAEMKTLIQKSERHCRMCRQHCRWRRRNGRCGHLLASTH